MNEKAYKIVNEFSEVIHDKEIPVFIRISTLEKMKIAFEKRYCPEQYEEDRQYFLGYLDGALEALK